MRRAPIVLTGTVAGLAAVLSFKAREPSLPAVAVASAPVGGGVASSGGSASGGGSAASSHAKSSSTATTKTATAVAKTATGDAIATRYGNVQVRVTVRGGKITNVEALALTGNDPKSAEISAQAEPLLRQSALAKQSAAIDAVSGATISSTGYEASLQSALDKVGFKAADGSRGSATIPSVREDHGGPPGLSGP
jgi:uncharacterized protein with FMN-binding domain